MSRMSLRRSLGRRGLPADRDFQGQNRRNLLRCQSGLTLPNASRHENMRPRITITSRVESCARCGFAFRSWYSASYFRGVSAASGRSRDEYEEMDEIACDGRQNRKAACEHSEDGAGHQRRALHVTPHYVTSNSPLNGISADNNKVKLVPATREQFQLERVTC